MFHTKYLVSITAVHTITDPDNPNIFTPNGDGINDTWGTDHIKDNTQAQLEVFNRYGQKVFETNGNKNNWDERFNGKPLPIRVYYNVLNLHNNFPVKSGWGTIL